MSSTKYYDFEKVISWFKVWISEPMGHSPLGQYFNSVAQEYKRSFGPPQRIPRPGFGHIHIGDKLDYEYFVTIFIIPIKPVEVITSMELLLCTKDNSCLTEWWYESHRLRNIWTIIRKEQILNLQKTSNTC